MGDRLTTIATFGNPVEAELARSRLEAEGLTAYLVDEETVGMAWHLGGAIGGIKLQVDEDAAERALALLPGRGASAGVEAPAPQEPEAEEDEPRLTGRERDADRAFRGVVIGLLFLPLQLYVSWLLLKVLVSDQALHPEKRRRALIAAGINLPLAALICWWLGWVFGG